MIEMESPKGTRLILLIVAVALTGALAGSLATYALLSASVRVPTKAQVKCVGVDVFADVDCTVSVTQIDWGFLDPGQTKDYSVYVESQSNVEMTLTMATEDWNPSNATAVVGLSWDCQGRQVGAGTVVLANFVLTVSQTTDGLSGFTFTIVITGSG
jgi:hypothetical protein